MASNKRYREFVPDAVQQVEAERGLQEADWYLPSSANPGVYLDSLERMFPEPPRPHHRGSINGNGNGNPSPAAPTRED